jgi:hypothetical protein
MNFPPHRCLIPPGGFLLLVPFRVYTIERMIGDVEKALTDLNTRISGKEKGVNAIT